MIKKADGMEWESVKAYMGYHIYSCKGMAMYAVQSDGEEVFCFYPPIMGRCISFIENGF